MAERKLNCWEVLNCGHERSDPPCPAATDASCDGINGGVNAGRLCWAVAGTRCGGDDDGAYPAKMARCRACPFFRRVKYEEGCHFQFLKPGLGVNDPRTLHKLLNDISKLLGMSRDVLACLAVRPLLGRIATHLRAATGAAAAAAYVLDQEAGLLRLEAHDGDLPRPESVPLEGPSHIAQAFRNRQLATAQADEGQITMAAVPIGSAMDLPGVLEIAKRAACLTTDDEWFLRQFGLTAGLGTANAKLVEDLHQLKSHDKAKSRFVALLMHHIASPLATVACSLQAIKTLGSKLPESDRLKLIENSLERITAIQGLSRRLLDLASIRSGTSLNNIQRVNPEVPLRQQLQARKARADQARVEITLEDRAGETTVEADPDGLAIIFGNLLDNAIKYSRTEDKRVEVSLTRAIGHVQIAFRDHGIGIPPEDQARIFEEFRRASNVAQAKASGFGLGLAIVRELVARYNGSIELQSTPGAGTTVTVSFPITEKTNDNRARHE